MNSLELKKFLKDNEEIISIAEKLGYEIKIETESNSILPFLNDEETFYLELRKKEVKENE